LILRDVLGWRASEVASLLDTSVASVNSALQRARGTLAQRFLRTGRDGEAPAVPESAERSLLARYMRAWEQGDMVALAALLKEDAVLTMPPAPTWFTGRVAIATFFRSLCFSEEPKRFRMLPTGANGQPACAAYEWEDGAGYYRFSGIMVLRLEGHGVADVTGFGDPRLSAPFQPPERVGARRGFLTHRGHSHGHGTDEFRASTGS
jgi:RNA polymerase sigma-70 factor (ECF subfamily)